MGDSTFSGGWIFAFLIIAVIFGWGNGMGGGSNAATVADINSAFAAQNAQNILLSSANNNYETAQLISGQNMAMMNQNNSNLINAIQGFNTTNQSIALGFASVNQNIADLGYRLDKCCCDIKTTLLENRLQDAQTALLTSQTNNIVNAQSQYLLSQLGTYTPV
jgi:hypothetical protein